MSRVLTAYIADRYVVCVTSPTSSHRLFQIGFSKSDASLFVSFPYMPRTDGIVGVATLEGNLAYPQSIRIGHEQPVTRHAVKYSHHPSGRAHFSLTGKVKPTVSRMACPLPEVRGHLFTIMAQGISLFHRMDARDKSTQKRGVIPFGFEHATPRAVKLVAYLWTESELSRNTSGSNGGKPWLLLRKDDGTTCLAILLATPITHHGSSCYLVLAAHEIPPPAKGGHFFFNFMGGFDSRHVGLDHSRPTSWLTCIYPSTFGQLEIPFSLRPTIDIAT